MRRQLIPFLLAAILSPGAALAGLEFCNEDSVEQTIAVGHKKGEDWVSEGWWSVAPGECKNVLGGDLQRRYYYWRAEAPERNFTNADYAFCTTRAAFDIVGDQDCGGRGYESQRFRKLDTGKTATHFTMTITPPGGVAPSDEQAAVGQYGEPYSNQAIFQSCDFQGVSYCTFVADGTQFFAYDDGRSDQTALNALRSLLPGAPIHVSGDLEAVHDSTADIVLREVGTRDRTMTDVMIDNMQGQWYSLADRKSQMTIIGAIWEDSYNGQPMGSSIISITGSCPEAPPGAGGLYLQLFPMEGGDPLCYSIDEIEGIDWSMYYVGQGDPLRFRRLD